MARKDKRKDLPSDLILSLSTKSQHTLALIFLAVLPMFLFYGPIVGGKQYFPHDTLQWRAGAESVIEHRETTGIEPLWAENMFSGMPAYFVSYAKSVPHIDNIISFFSTFHPLLRYWILLSGLYILLILLKARPFTAAMGSVFIAFTTYIPIIIGAGHNTKFSAFVFVPWMFIGYWMLTRTDRRWLSFFVFTTAVLLEFRANHPQITYYFLYLMAIWWIFDGYRLYKENKLAQWGRDTALLIGGGTLALVSNIQPLWSRYEYSPYSIRGGSALSDGVSSGSGLTIDYAFAWSQGWGELLTLLIPNLFGGASPDYWGPKSVTSGPHYLGAVAFLLFLYGLIYAKRREKYIFLTTGILTMLFSLGSHFPLLNNFMYHVIPFFNKFRAPETWLIVTTFCFSVIAVLGLNAILDGVLEKEPRHKKRLYYPILFAGLIGLAFTFAGGSLLDFEKPGERQQIARYLARQNNVSADNPQVQQRVAQYLSQQVKPKRKQLAEDDAFRFTLLIVLTGALIMGFHHRKIPAGVAVTGLLLIASFDMLSVAERYDNDGNLRSDDINRERLIQQRQRPLDAFIQKHVEETSVYPFRVYPLKDNAFNNATMCYFYPSVGGYSGAKLSIYQDLIERHLSRLNPEVLNMLNVKYITTNSRLGLPGEKVAYKGNDGMVLENTNVLPKAFFSDSLIYAESPNEAIGLLNPENGFDASRHAVIEQEIPYQPERDTSATIEITEYGPRNISLTYNRQSNGFLVLSEIYYPAGWRAYIDGEEVPIYKTNYVLRGLFVPAGQHDIAFKFNPVSHIWGTRIAWGGNIIVWLIGLAALAKWYRGKNSLSPKNDEA